MSEKFIKIPNEKGFIMVRTPKYESKPIEDKKDKKLNLKIKSDDLIMIDGMSKLLGSNRSQILEMMISNILLDELLSIEDLDARLLLAEAADSLMKNKEANTLPWTHKAFNNEINHMFWCIRNFSETVERQERRNSDVYNFFKKKLDEGSNDEE